MLWLNGSKLKSISRRNIFWHWHLRHWIQRATPQAPHLGAKQPLLLLSLNLPMLNVLISMQLHHLNKCSDHHNNCRSIKHSDHHNKVNNDNISSIFHNSHHLRKRNSHNHDNKDHHINHDKSISSISHISHNIKRISNDHNSNNIHNGINHDRHSNIINVSHMIDHNSNMISTTLHNTNRTSHKVPAKNILNQPNSSNDTLPSQPSSTLLRITSIRSQANTETSLHARIYVSLHRLPFKPAKVALL
jgi:hypothetical protein